MQANFTNSMHVMLSKAKFINMGYSRGIRMSNNLEISDEINDIIYFFTGLYDKQIMQFRINKLRIITILSPTS